MDFNKMKSSDLLEIYESIDNFLKFLDKEQKDNEKLGDTNE